MGTLKSPTGLAATNDQKPVPKKRVPKVNKDGVNDDDVKLEDPTSVTLMNSFLIKNAGASFEQYHAQMKKQRKPKMDGSSAAFGHSATLNSSSLPFSGT